MTLVLVIVMLVLIWLSGLGITLLLFRFPDSNPRLLICPFVGASTAVFLFFFLVPLNLTGSQTAVLDMVLLGVLAAFGAVKSPLRREDWHEAWPVLLISSGGFLMAAWPLLASGYRDYVGYGNPDAAFFITTLRYFSSHTLRLPDPHFFRGLDPGGIVGVLVYAYQTSVVMSIPIEDLFFVLCAAVVFLGPTSIYVFCRIGLRLGRWKCLVIACIGAISSIAAYTFYLNSLGTLTVMTSVPIAVGVAICYFRTLERKYAIVLAVLVAGSMYNYVQGTIAFVTACGAVGAEAVFRRNFPRRRLITLAVASVTAIVLPSIPYLSGVPRVLSVLSAGPRLTVTPTADEIQTSFALFLTERGLPFFWGLAIPYSPLTLFGSEPMGLAVFLGGALLLFATLFFFCLSERLSGLPTRFRIVLVALSALVAYFFVKGVAYGVFKLVIWIHFLFLVALTACVLNGLSNRGNRAAKVALAGVLMFYVVFNTTLAIKLGRSSLGLGDQILSTIPELRLRDMLAIESLPPQPNVLVGLSDGATRQWLVPFLGVLSPHSNIFTILDDTFRFVGEKGLLMEDSEPMAFLPDCDSAGHADLLSRMHLRCRDLASASFLDWKEARDLGGRAKPGGGAQIFLPCKRVCRLIPWFSAAVGTVQRGFRTHLSRGSAILSDGFANVRNCLY